MSAERPLTDNEQALLNGLLKHADFDGAAALRAQADNVLASVGCSCGCGTIDLHPQGTPDRVQLTSALPCEGVVYDEHGTVIGGLLAFMDNGLLCALEVYSYREDPLPLPSLQRVHFVG